MRTQTIGIELFCSTGQIVALDEGVLIRHLPGRACRSVMARSIHQAMKRMAMNLGHCWGESLGGCQTGFRLLQEANHARCLNRSINLNGQTLPHAFIQHIQGLKLSSPSRVWLPMCKCNRWRTDAVALPGLFAWAVGIGLFQNTDNLGLGELRLA